MWTPPSGALAPSPRGPRERPSSRHSRVRITRKSASREKAKPHPDHHPCSTEKAHLSLRLHAHHLAVLHDDVIHGFVQHVCPPIDGTQSVVARVVVESPSQENTRTGAPVLSAPREPAPGHEEGRPRRAELRGPGGSPHLCHCHRVRTEFGVLRPLCSFQPNYCAKGYREGGIKAWLLGARVWGAEQRALGEPSDLTCQGPRPGRGAA